ncbi:MAG TPA: hypothetical protein VF282_05810 [Bacillota bacterium]
MRYRTYAALLTLVLALTACGSGSPGGTATTSPGAASAEVEPSTESGPEPATANGSARGAHDTQPAAADGSSRGAPDAEPAAGGGPGGATGAPAPPERPAATELTVQVEQVELALPFYLIQPAALHFSTYLFAEFEVEMIDEPMPGIRAYDPHPDRQAFIEVTAYPDDTTEADARAAFQDAAADDDAWVQPGVPIRPWALDAVTVDHGDDVDVYFLLEHAGRYLLMRQHFAWAEAEAFAPVLQGFLDEWQWDDGEYLVTR